MRPLPGGYLVRLHFAETKYDQAGRRKFHVDLNGARVLTDFDIFAEAGAKDKAVVKDFANVLPDKNGDIVLRLSNGSVDQAKLDGLEILPSPPANPSQLGKPSGCSHGALSPWLQPEKRLTQTRRVSRRA